MNFRFIDLLKLTLQREPVPSYGDTHNKQFPEKIPLVLMGLCFINSVLKLSVPMILEETYSKISGNMDRSNYVLLISVVILALGLSQLVLIAYGLILTLYRQNVKRQLSSRMISNNFKDYKHFLQSTSISDKADSFSMELWMKISTKLSVYLHNYYESYLSLIFECLNIVIILIYLFYKLSFSLFFGLAIAGMVMYKTIKTANLMTTVRFQNIALRARKLKILEQFFNRVTEFKMTWLDKWIYERVTKIEEQFQSGLRQIKLLDCWCVALWQFTGVGISSIVISAYFLLGLSDTVDKNSVFTPSTFIYLLSMLNNPLNALSWYIAGIKTAERAIKEIENDVRLSEESGQKYQKIEYLEGNYVVKEEIVLKFDQGQENSHKNNIKIVVPVKQLKANKIYSFVGDLGEDFLSKLSYLFEGNVMKGYVEQNAWMPSSSLQTVCMEEQLTRVTQAQQASIQNLMQLFECSDIPLHTNTQNYSGGEKLRVSLVRAFHLGQVIVINSNLNSLDKKMKEKVQRNITNLVKGTFSSIGKSYTVFIKENEQIADEMVSFQKQQSELYRLTFKQTQIKADKENKLAIEVSSEIKKFMEKALYQLSQSQKQKTKKQDKLKERQMKIAENKQQERSSVSLSTFKIYYKSPKHITFLISMLFVTILSNYYNYYVNTYINLSEYNENQVLNIILITAIFAVGLFFRSYYFADANLTQSSRICHHLNKNIIMEELSFYQSEEKVSENSEQLNSKSKLICALTSDTQTIADHFPFSTNIFANNVTVILSSVIVILIEVPQILILMVLLVAYANNLNKISHKKDEALKLALKDKEVEVYKMVSDFEAGRKYVILHGKFEAFSNAYSRLRQQFMEIEWMSDKYRGYINLKYKSVMILFLVIGIAVYSFVNIISEDISNPQEGKSSGLALLIQYTIQLSNYLLFFTMSIWEIKGQAVSIERVRPFLQEKPSIKTRTNDSNRVIQKIQRSLETSNNLEKNGKLIVIESLNFAYESNSKTQIFKKLSLQVSQRDKIIIRGRSGSGKTTLYKLLTSAYPNILNFVNEPYHISFSPQHPLVLPDTTDIEENLNPYKIKCNLKELEAVKSKYSLSSQKTIEELSYEQKLVVNNLRAYLHGLRGIVIYDEPLEVIASDEETYLIVTHHHDFKHNCSLELSDGQLIQL